MRQMWKWYSLIVSTLFILTVTAFEMERRAVEQMNNESLVDVYKEGYKAGARDALNKVDALLDQRINEAEHKLWQRRHQQMKE